MKKGIFVFLFLVAIIGCAGVQAQPPVATSAPAIVMAAAPATATFCENLSCGKRFPATSGWQAAYANTTGQGYGFCFEILVKGSSNYKVKVLAIVGGEAIHLDCARELPTHQACIDWLIQQGYQLQQDGAEAGGPSGLHLTVERGPIYRIPERLYQK